jgi:hypothetical protein
MPLEPPEDAPPVPQGTALLRAVAETMARVRHALEHGDMAAARHAARHLVLHLEALPDAREDYERLCAEADRELAANPNVWDRPLPRGGLSDRGE